MYTEPYQLPSGGKLRAAGLYPVWLIGMWASGLLGLWVATQYVAYQWHYASYLGAPWLSMRGHQLYAPWEGLFWLWRWVFQRDLWPLWWDALKVGGCVAGGGWLAVTLAMIYRARMVGGKSDLHGSARWAEKPDIERMELLGGQGMYVGAWQDGRRRRYLQHGGPKNILVVAPPRTGKTAGVIIPTALTWPHSLLVHDPKSEVWQRSAGYRQHEGHACVWFDPVNATGRAAKWNPLLEVRPHPYDVRDVLTITEALLQKDMVKATEEGQHWTNTADQFLLGALLHVLYAEPDKSLAGCLHLLTNPYRPLTDTLAIMRTTQHDPEKKYRWRDPWTGTLTTTHPVVASAVRALEMKSAREQSSVLSSVLEHFTLYYDAILADNTRSSDFSVADLLDPTRQVSVYLAPPSSEESHLMPLLRMFVNFTLRRALEQISDPARGWAGTETWRLGLILEEFPQLGKLPALQAKLAVLPGYGVKTLLTTQDISQIYQTYGKEESITSTCDVLVAFAPNKQSTAEWLSKETGRRTVHREQRSYSGDRRDMILDHVVASETETERPLLTMDEVRRLPQGSDTDPQDPGHSLVFVTGHFPVYAQKIRYYQDAEFARRAAMPAPQESDRIRHDWSHWLDHKAILGTIVEPPPLEGEIEKENSTIPLLLPFPKGDPS